MLPIPNELFIRLATERDVDAATALLRDCIADMRQVGIDQWDEIYPGHDTVLTDIRAGAMHLSFRQGGTLVGALVLNECQDAEWSTVPWTITSVPILVLHRLVVSPPH